MSQLAFAPYGVGACCQWEAKGNLKRLGQEELQEFGALLGLRHTPGLGGRYLAKLLAFFLSAKNATQNLEDWSRAGVPARCAQAYQSNIWQRGAFAEWRSADSSAADIILWTSTHYPRLLKEMPDAPGLLYYKGDKSLFKAPCVAVVGSRNPTSHSVNVAAAFGRNMAMSGITVVSGMALGIDRQAHAGALSGPGRSIGVLGTGIDIEYPRSNKDIYGLMAEKGLLVSEFPPRTPPAASNFPIRNRIISGLSLGVVVIEAVLRSGSLITARLALEQNREVFAVPGNAMDAHALGCQNLIRQGATPVFSVEDIVRDMVDLLRPYGIRPSEGDDAQIAQVSGEPAIKPLHSACNRVNPAVRQTKDVAAPLVSGEAAAAGNALLMDGNADKLLAALSEEGILDMDQLSERTRLDSGQLHAAILGLEMLGMINRLPGARFEVAK